jgi:hypothetical protein
MSLIGTLPASASAVFNLDFLPEFFLIQNSNSASQSASNFSVVTSGTQLMSVTSAARLTALSKFDSGAILNFDSAPSATNTQTSQYIRLATGRINKASTINLTNSVATVRDIYAASTNASNIARRAVEQSINPSANATFSNFEALFFDPSNVLRAQVTFANGFVDEYTPTELQALYSKYHVSDDNGTLSGLTTIDSDSGAGLISQVTLYAGSVSTVVVLKTDYVAI